MTSWTQREREKIKKEKELLDKKDKYLAHREHVEAIANYIHKSPDFTQERANLKAAWQKLQAASEYEKTVKRKDPTDGKTKSVVVKSKRPDWSILMAIAADVFDIHHSFDDDGPLPTLRSNEEKKAAAEAIKSRLKGNK